MSDQLLYWPLHPVPKFYGQKFGDNMACVSLDGTNKVISCNGNNPPDGYRSLYGPKGHLGIDLPIPHGTPFYIAQDGVVDFIDTNSKSGLDIRVISEVKGRKLKHIYEHLLGYQHKVGDTVFCGQVGGWCDNTGYSSGNHLHFQVEEFINGTWVPIDPVSVLSNISAKDALYFNDKIKYLKEQIAILAEQIAEYLRKNSGRTTPT